MVDLQNSIVYILEDQLALYNDLYELIKEELFWLKKPDLEILQQISQKKHYIVNEIEASRMEMIYVLSQITGEDSPSLEPEKILYVVPDFEQDNVRQIFVEIRNIKKDIQILSEKNKVFVEDCLEFIDDLIDIVLGGNEENTLYDNEMNLLKKRNKTGLLHKEV